MFDKSRPSSPALKAVLIPSIAQSEPLLLEGLPFFLDIPYLSAMEKSSPAGVEYRYVIVKQGSKPSAFFYFQAIDLSRLEVGSIVQADQYSRIMQGLSQLIQKLLFGVRRNAPKFLLVCGNMCISGDYGVYIRPGLENMAGDFLMMALETAQADLNRNGKVVAMVVKDFLPEKDYFGKTLKSKKFNALVMDPIMEMSIPNGWSDFGDYLDAISAKYRQRYLQASKKLMDTELRTLSTSEIERETDRINDLYHQVQAKSPVQLIKPDAAYLLQLANQLQEKVTFRAIYKDGKMIAFLTGINAGDHYEAHHIGIDYAFNKSHALYLNILYLYIQLALEHKAQKLSFGRTALEMKTTVGAVPVQCNAYLKLSNTLLNGMACHLLPEESSDKWIPRNPFKRN
jgi:hypothetical protein